MITKTSAYLVLLISLLIAGVAAWFSIAGLAQLFAAEFWAVVIMASILEIGKVTTTFALHHSWVRIPGYIKWPATSMVILLMVITSLGVFGKLSAGHLEQESPIAVIESQIDAKNQTIDSLTTRIDIHSGVINTAKSELERINKASSAYLESGSINRSLTVRDKYRKEIDEQNTTIKTEQAAINKLRTEIDPIQQEIITLKSQLSTVHAKLGPVKYVAELFGIDSHDKDSSGKAVRLVIVILMAAFDPLAIILVCLFDWMLSQVQVEERERRKREAEEQIQQMKDEEEKLERERIHALKLQQIQAKSEDKDLQTKLKEMQAELKKRDQAISGIDVLVKERDSLIQELNELKSVPVPEPEIREIIKEVLVHAEPDRTEIDNLNSRLQELTVISLAKDDKIRVLDFRIRDMIESNDQLTKELNELRIAVPEQKSKEALSQEELIKLDHLRDQIQHERKLLDQERVRIQQETIELNALIAERNEWKPVLQQDEDPDPIVRENSLRDIVQAVVQSQQSDMLSKRVQELDESTDERIAEILEEEPELLNDPEIQSRMSEELSDRIERLVRKKLRSEQKKS